MFMLYVSDVACEGFIKFLTLMMLVAQSYSNSAIMKEIGGSSMWDCTSELSHGPFFIVVTEYNGYNRMCPLPRIGVSLRNMDKVPRGRSLEHTRLSNSSTAREYLEQLLIA